MQADAKQADLFVAMQGINKRYGGSTIGLASAHRVQKISQKIRFQYPMLTAS